MKFGTSKVRLRSTAVAARRANLLTAFSVNGGQLIATVVTDLLKTERNGILIKSQTTVELAKARAENEASKNLSGTLIKIIDSVVTGRRRPHDDGITG
jgi:hypothetical protein